MGNGNFRSRYRALRQTALICPHQKSVVMPQWWRNCTRVTWRALPRTTSDKMTTTESDSRSQPNQVASRVGADSLRYLAWPCADRWRLDARWRRRPTCRRRWGRQERRRANETCPEYRRTHCRSGCRFHWGTSCLSRRWCRGELSSCTLPAWVKRYDYTGVTSCGCENTRAQLLLRWSRNVEQVESEK